MEQCQTGFRFFPSEEQLINDHLMRKVLGYTDNCVIPELEDFYAWDPWDLPRVYQEISNVPSDGWDWFFLCPSPYLAQNSERVKRKTRSGNWKITCQKDYVKSRDTRVLIGTKRILTFYKKHVKTGWVMHEYHLNPELLHGDSSILQIPYILCRLKRKPEESLDISPSNQGIEDKDPESSYQATFESLPQFEMLEDNLPDYGSHCSYDLQPHMYDDSQGNDFFDPWSSYSHP